MRSHLPLERLKGLVWPILLQNPSSVQSKDVDIMCANPGRGMYTARPSHIFSGASVEAEKVVHFESLSAQSRIYGTDL